MPDENITIRITETMTEEDWRVLTTWREHVFPPEGRGTDWSEGKLHILASSEGAAVGHIGFDSYTLVIEGEKRTCIGVGAVVVVPEYQGRHLPKRMFSELRAWRDEKFPDVPLALFCIDSLAGYYTKHDFMECTNAVYYLQQGTYQQSGFIFMTDRPVGTDDRIDIPSNPW